MTKQKKCRYCKSEFTPFNSLQKCCTNYECIKQAVKDAELKTWNKKKTKLKKDLMTTSDWLKIAQQTFNKFIRERDKGKMCISCGQHINGVKHASHYYSAGGHSNVRFNENNVHVSCYKCNVELSGNLLNYQIAIRDKIGGEELMKLHELAHITKKWTIEELQEINTVYKEKLKELKKLYI
jgi:hypothetical protein